MPAPYASLRITFSRPINAHIQHLADAEIALPEPLHAFKLCGFAIWCELGRGLHVLLPQRQPPFGDKGHRHVFFRPQRSHTRDIEAFSTWILDEYRLWAAAVIPDQPCGEDQHASQ
jgi:hypothetical protein